LTLGGYIEPVISTIDEFYGSYIVSLTRCFPQPNKRPPVGDKIYHHQTDKSVSCRIP